MSPKVPVRTVSDFLDTEYRDYAVYTVEGRAIPSMVDGLKPSQRKIAWAASKLWPTGKEKDMKVFQLGGRAAAMAFYHHGSLDATIIGMTQTFKNSLPLFEGIGQFGSLRAPQAGAPRYVSVKFNDAFRRLYQDFDLTQPQYEEGEEIEPRYFLPIVPTVLLNGGSGIAVGFATNILNRHPIDVIDAVLEVLDTGFCTEELKPWISGFSGDVFLAVDATSDRQGRSWVFRGAYNIKTSTTVEITEIPPSFTFEKYEQHLESLVDKKLFHGYDDGSNDQIRYTLRTSKAQLAELVNEDKLDALLKIEERATENITVLDPDGNIKVYSRAQDLVVDFTAFRLGYYVRRRLRLIERLTEKIGYLGERIRFIKGVHSGTIVVNGATKDAIVAQLAEHNFLTRDGSYDYLLSMPIYALTQERLDSYVSQRDQEAKELAAVEAATPEDLYRKDLLDLRTHLASKKGGADGAHRPAPKKREKVVLDAGASETQKWVEEAVSPMDLFDMLAGPSKKS